MNKQILAVYEERMKEVKRRIEIHFIDFDTEGVEEKCRHANSVMHTIHHLNTIVNCLRELNLITNEENFEMKEQIYFLSKEYAYSINNKMGKTILDVDYKDFMMFEKPKIREMFKKEIFKNKKPFCSYSFNQTKFGNVDEYAKQIKACRKAKNMTQTELANKLGLTKQSIINYEKGITFPTKEKLKKLNEIFGI